MTGPAPTKHNGGNHAHPFSVAAAAFVAAALIPTAAAAQQAECDDRDKVLGHLARKYQEAAVAMGVTSAGGLVEVLTTDDGETWTIILTTPQGMSCLVAEGEGWRLLLPIKKGLVS